MDAVLDQGAFTNGQDVAIAGFHLLIHHNPTTLTDIQTCSLGKLIAGQDPGRNQNHIGGQAFLFGKLKQPAIIWLTVPLALVGITAGLLATGGAFDFMSMLGALSLVGLLIKNAIVLIEEIDQQIETGKEGFEAILDSSVSRMRPVMLAAATTILGLIPLLSDVFFENMSVTIMAGLGFASVLTLIVVPTLYAVFFRIRRP